MAGDRRGALPRSRSADGGALPGAAAAAQRAVPSRPRFAVLLGAREWLGCGGPGRDPQRPAGGPPAPSGDSARLRAHGRSAPPYPAERRAVGSVDRSPGSLVRKQRQRDVRLRLAARGERKSSAGFSLPCIGRPGVGRVAGPCRARRAAARRMRRDRQVGQHRVLSRPADRDRRSPRPGAAAVARGGAPQSPRPKRANTV